MPFAEMRRMTASKRRCGPLHEQILIRLASVGAVAAIDDDMQSQVFLFKEDFHEELIEAAVDIPVDATQVIARDIVAVISEFDGLTTFLAATFTQQFAAKYAAAGDIKLLDLRDEARIEEILD